MECVKAASQLIKGLTMVGHYSFSNFRLFMIHYSPTNAKFKLLYAKVTNCFETNRSTEREVQKQKYGSEKPPISAWFTNMPCSKGASLIVFLPYAKRTRTQV